MQPALDRRDLLKLTTAFAVLPIVSGTRLVAAGSAFIASDVDEMAEELSRHPFLRPSYTPPTSLNNFGYDEYRDIRFRPERAAWASKNASIMSLQFFLASFIYKDAIDVFLVEDGQSQRMEASRDLFEFGLSDGKVPPTGDFAFSGFRVHGALNRPDVNDEIAAFNGASYFRALGRGHSYGLSARGLAINTVGKGPEEFPRFRAFWVEKPRADALLSFHALLDGPSTTGSYHFVLRPGPETLIDVQVSLFPRRSLEHVGLAPLTSMFLFDSRNRHNFRDFRLAVHDSNGLAIKTAGGEHLWRPLLNPNTVQTSFYEVDNPRGFGLVQRQRVFDQFQDLEARYEARPSAWVEPLGEWGSGTVELLELPIGAEWGDNIVAYWRPAQALPAFQRYNYGYRLHWCDDFPPTVRRIINTFVGISAGMPLFMIDYEKADDEVENQAAIVWSSKGTTSKPIVEKNRHTGGIRCFFSLDPQGQKLVDLRLTLGGHGPNTTLATEVWTYRWLGD